MNRLPLKTSALLLLALATGSAGGYWFAQRQSTPAAETSGVAAERKALYWYDPMVPQQRFDAPGKSPFMDMQLVPRYADDESNSGPPAVRLEPGIQQNLGVRLASVGHGRLDRKLQVTGLLTFNDRDVALLQTRAGGFVERTYALAPGDVVKAGAPVADILVPEWAGLQEEYLALQGTAEPTLREAARQRLLLAGMPPALVVQVARSGRARPVITLGSPIAGVIRELNVRSGMTLPAGAPLARINGLGQVWLETAVPETQAAGLKIGQPVDARLPAFPDRPVTGTLASILPENDQQSRTLRLRIELPNPDGQLRPGMTVEVSLALAGESDVLQIPSEAVIRTGKRNLVMLAEDHGRFRPVEVRLGQENGGQVAVLQGLEEGQRVVASGQFLIDSEASLKGIETRTDVLPVPSASTSTLHEAEGRIVAINAQGLTISHGPFHTLGMPGMTMTFPLARAGLADGLKVGDRIRFGVSQGDTGLVIEQVSRQEAQP
ncbi:efflux RND transporter periplasmic adaptor subunit [Pseudomonas sp. GD04087]|uniref:efflux RND transporter periplasmic adaptor subunit n=1 Tax=unclassified Pseudomonas TaxID=196821 RepID=UPI0024480A17|nr:MULTISPECIES: efflux RND transporter periplasmic adaptor subunit [unclassified Pseudomonas]MDH0291857.1 efflux RND transporter periplasmic adaptor subunit [Pseudomonas sp. GD04087]MDH1050051.1 efflux RND transporter periplasmic adaptor subunit [Pseudomonas sp. GD03903]MDH2001859.1 efflux RND transporter periplasmic adaptor subunit [Pseudomonas sp. GD03691]